MIYNIIVSLKNIILSKSERLFYKIFPILLRLLSPQAVGTILGKVAKVKCSNFDVLKKSIFAIEAGRNTKDLQELSAIKTFNIIYVDQFWISIISVVYLKKKNLRFANHYYENVDVPEKEVKLLLVSLGFFLKEVQRRYNKIECILTPNYEQGITSVFHKYAQIENIGIVAFHYEHPVIAVSVRSSENCFREYSCKALDGLKILLWHESAKKMLVDTDYATQGNTIVSGPPRFNRWFDIINIPNTEKKYITLLSFPGYDYFAPFTYADAVLAFQKAANVHKNYTFVVKCKDGWHVSQTLRIINDDSSNIVLSTDIDMIDLLSQSKVIIGFNSLSFLEALLAQAHLILPYWGDSKHDPYLLQVNPQDPEAQEIIDVANSREHFAELLEQRITGDDYQGDIKKRIEYLNKYIYFDENNKSVDIFEKVFLGTYEQN